ncbi:MAG: hypothetical protein AAF512_26700, partial [Pseudomonadota bacterium]
MYQHASYIQGAIIRLLSDHLTPAEAVALLQVYSGFNLVRISEYRLFTPSELVLNWYFNDDIANH